MRQRHFDITMQCEQCGEVVYASRYDKRFCNSKCRSKNHRTQLKRLRLVKRIKDDMSTLLKEATTSEAWESCLDDIQAAIDRARIQTT